MCLITPEFCSHIFRRANTPKEFIVWLREKQIRLPSTHLPHGRLSRKANMMSPAKSHRLQEPTTTPLRCQQKSRVHEPPRAGAEAMLFLGQENGGHLIPAHDLPK